LSQRAGDYSDIASPHGHRIFGGVWRKIPDSSHLSRGKPGEPADRPRIEGHKAAREADYDKAVELAPRDKDVRRTRGLFRLLNDKFDDWRYWSLLFDHFFFNSNDFFDQSGAIDHHFFSHHCNVFILVVRDKGWRRRNSGAHRFAGFNFISLNNDRNWTSGWRQVHEFTGLFSNVV
jgi:hypothetical protein